MTNNETTSPFFQHDDPQVNPQEDPASFVCGCLVLFGSSGPLWMLLDKRSGGRPMYGHA